MAKKRVDSAAQPPALHRWGGGAILLLFLLFTAGLISVNAQQPPFPGVQYARGQDVSPLFDGWERNPDGTFTMYFGYLNRNSEEEVDVPIGPENTFDLGNGDQGQPTHFLVGTDRARPREARKWWQVKVVVPKDWPKDKRVVWTLTNKGRTNVAKGWLAPEWEVAKEGILLSDYRSEVQQEYTAGGYAGGYKPGTISITGSTAQTITLPATATVTATATATGTDVKGVRIQWIHYRGPGKVQFDPAVSPAVSGKPTMSETKVSFSMPGNYRIRALATDGKWFSTYDVDVKVSPSTSAEKAR